MIGENIDQILLNQRTICGALIKLLQRDPKFCLHDEEVHLTTRLTNRYHETEKILGLKRWRRYMITKERPTGSDIWDGGHTLHLYGKASQDFVRKTIRPTKEDIEEQIESHRRMQEFSVSLGFRRIYKLPDGTICSEYKDLIIPDI